MSTPNPVKPEPKPPHRLIRASAGSGKTYQLTGQYLELLGRGASPDTILATTFTRKAAGEIFGRVIERLLKAIRGEGDAGPGSAPLMPRADAARLLRSLADRLHRVNVSTLDSFFHRLGRAFQLELDLPPEPTLIDESSAQAAALRGEAIEAVLAEAATDDAAFVALLDLLRRLDHGRAGRSVTRAIDAIVTAHAEVYRQAPSREAWTALDVPEPLDDAAVAVAVEAWRQMKPHLPTTQKGTPKVHWQNSWVKIGQAAKAGDWDAVATGGLLGKVLAGEATFDRTDISRAWLEACEPFVHQIKAALLGRVARQTAATHEFMARFTRHHDELRRRRGTMLYSDMTHRLASAEAVLPEVYFRLDAAVTHLLLDEFQDTSLDQWQVLSPFAEEVAAHADSSRELFVVGDTKQAIYGWRGGCVELFDTVADLVPPRGHETLATSYRSSQTVLDAVNTVFSRIAECSTLNEDEDDAAAAAAWGAGYERHVAAKPDLPGYVRFEVSRDAEALGDDEDEAAPASPHEEHVADRVAAIRAAAPGRSIGVLVRSNAMVHRLIYELRRRNIPASGEGGNPLAESPAVAAVLSALLLADHPGDTASAFHVRNSPLNAVLDESGTGFQPVSDSGTGFQPVFDRRSKSVPHTESGITGGMPAQSVESAPALARRIRADLLEHGYAATLARWTRALAGDCDARGLTRLTRLVELAEAWDAGAGSDGEGLRPSRFVDHVEAARVEEPGDAAVRVMTIHKSKGLEFDAVVLPELDKALSNSFDVLTDREDPTGPIEAVFRHADEAVRSMSPQLDRAYRQARRRQRQEDLCGLYVAMTRARQGLYLIAKPATTPRLPKLSFAAILRDTLGDPDEGYAVDDAGWAGTGAEVPAAGAEAAPVLRVALATAGTPRRSWASVSPSSLHGADGAEGGATGGGGSGGTMSRGGRVHAADLLRLHDSAALEAGSSLHEQLEAIRYADDLADAEVEALQPELREALRHDAVRAALSPRWPKEALWRERKFVVRDDGRLMQGAFDRVAVRLDGAGQPLEARVVDFKSDRVEGDGLAERVELYRPQLQAYRRAAATLLRLPVEKVAAELVFLRPGVAVEMNHP